MSILTRLRVHIVFMKVAALFLSLLLGSPGWAGPRDTGTADAALVEAEANIEPACQNPAFNPQCKAARDERTCGQNGGRWTTCLGRLCRPGCVCPTARAGCPCSSSADCGGDWCLVRSFADLADEPRATGTCQEVEPLFGCLQVATNRGMPPSTICID